MNITILLLLLFKSINHFVAVGTKVGVNIRHMHPPGAGLRVVLPYQLVEGQVIADVIKPLAAFLQVATDAKVGGLALHMLTVVNAAHGLVECLAAESGAYRDGFFHGHAQGFQYVFGQIGEINLLLRRWLVINAQLGGRLAAVKFLEGKVLCNWYVHISLFFVNGFYFVFFSFLALRCLHADALAAL